MVDLIELLQRPWLWLRGHAHTPEPEPTLRWTRSRLDETPTTFTVKLSEDTLDGGWVAECVELPGCVSDGDTQQEALDHVVEAISGVLSVRLQRHAREASGKVLDLTGAPDAARRIALPL